MRAAAGPLMLDLLLVPTLVIWARGGCNRGLRVVLPVLTLSFFVGGRHALQCFGQTLGPRAAMDMS